MIAINIVTTLAETETESIRFERIYSPDMCECGREAIADIAYTLFSTPFDGGWVCDACAREMFASFMRDHDGAWVAYDGLGFGVE